MTSPDLHTLTGAYAADALTPDERALFEGHLRLCVSCAQEVQELQETVGRLGAATAVVVPDRLRADVMAEVVQTRQVTPLLRDGGHPRPRSVAQRWPLAAAACLVAIATGLGVVSANLYQDLQDERRMNEQISALLTAPDARTTTAATGAGLRGTVVLSQRRAELIFFPGDLPAVPQERTYQLWLLGPGAPRSAGLLATGAQRSQIISGVSRDIDALGLTVEPAGGSRQPTSDPVLVVQLPRA